MRIGLQAELERRVFIEQQLGQLLPDRGVGQRLHIAVAQLRAVAAAGARAGLALVHHGDVHTAMPEFVGGRQADDACAEYTYVHVVCPCQGDGSMPRLGLGLLAWRPMYGAGLAFEQCQCRCGL